MAAYTAPPMPSGLNLEKSTGVSYKASAKLSGIVLVMVALLKPSQRARRGCQELQARLPEEAQNDATLILISNIRKCEHESACPYKHSIAMETAESIQLGSPLGYDDGLASQFSALTANCSASGYGYTKPTPKSLNGASTAVIATTTAPSGTISGCESFYTIADQLTGDSVAVANNVSTFALLFSNGLSQCSEFPAVGTFICLPEQCASHQVIPADTCPGIAEAFSISLT